MQSAKTVHTQELGQGIRSRFPIFERRAPLAYLDTAASSQKPREVIERLSRYLSEEHANIHRGAYSLSAEATRLYDEAREKIARFVSAPDSRGIIFTRGTTEGVNLVAHAYEKFFSPGDVILLSLLEHHSNIVPWQLLAARKKLKIEFANIHADGSLDLADLLAKISALKPKLVAITHISNALGTIVPLADVISRAHECGAKVLVDGAQATPHTRVRLDQLDADFYVFSAHKMYGPTGIGALYAKPELLEVMDPFLGGGDMIQSVTTEGSTWAEIPAKFEAGTPAIAEAIAFGTAVDFIEELGLSRIAEHEHKLAQHGFELLRKEPGVTLYGPATSGKEQASILSFNVQGVHAHDLATVADEFHVQFRAGHHCAMPLMRRLGIGSSARVSFGVYSCEADFEPLLAAIRHARKMFA